MLEEATRLISEQFGFYHAGIFLYQNGKFEKLLLTAASSYEGKYLVKKKHSLLSGEGIVGNVALSKEIELVSDVTKEPNYVPTIPRTKGEIAFPLIVHGSVLGTLDIQSDKVIVLPEAQINTLRNLADQLANAIYAAQHYQYVQRRSQALHALYKAGNEITSATSIDVILSKIAKNAFRLARSHKTRAHYGLVALKIDDKMQITTTFPSAYLQKLHKAVGTEIDLNSGYKDSGKIGIAGRVLLTDKSLRIGNVQNHPDYINFNPNTASQLSVPIQWQGQTIGVIVVEHPVVDIFEEEDELYLKMLASQAAIAIHMNRIKGFVGKFTAVRWMKMVSDTWQHSIWREVAISLRYTAYIKQLLVWKHPISDIRKQIDLLDKVAHRIKDIPITAPLSTEGEIECLEIYDLIQTHFKYLWNRDDFQSVTLDIQNISGKCFVRAGRSWLRQAFELLAENAVQAMLEAKSPNKRLIVACHEKENKLIITFSDTGPGIPDNFIKHLFVDRIEESKGTGMGLLLVKTILETYDGTIRVVESTPLGQKSLSNCQLIIILIHKPKLTRTLLMCSPPFSKLVL